MKTSYRLFGLIAAISAMSLASCQKENFNPAGEEGTITVHATVEDVANASKSHIVGTQLYWDAEEHMEIIAFDETNDAKHGTSTGFTVSNNRLTATFTVPDITESKTKIAGVHPASVSVADNKYADKYKVILPSVQNATADSYDPSAYIVVTRPEDVSSLGDSKEWHASYVRVTALNRFDVTGLKESIKSVTITFPTGQEAAGRRYIDLNSATGGEVYHDGTNEITVNYAAPLVPADGAATVWFASWNVSVAVGETVTIKAASDTKTYTKKFTAGTEFSLLENYLNILPIDMTGATEEDIQTGEDLSGEYLIVTTNGSTNWAYMSDYSNDDYFNGVLSSAPASRAFATLTKDDFVGADDYIWTVSKVTDGYTLHNASKNYYLNLSSSNSTTANTSEDPITLDVTPGKDKGQYQISYPGSTRSLRGNYVNGAWRFANYATTGSQEDIYLLPWVESTEPILIVSEASKTVDATAESVTFEYTTRNIEGDVTATEEADAYNIISNVSATNGVVTVTLTPNTEDKEKTATVILSATDAEPVMLTITQKAYVASRMIKFVGFEADEGYKPDNNYQNDHSQGDWTIWQGAVTSTKSAVISGSQSLQLRGYANQTESYFMLKDQSVLTGVTYIKFKAKRAKGSPNLKISYKMDSGEWSEPKEISVTSTASDYTYIVSSTIHSNAVNIKFELTTPGTKDTQLSVDDIEFYNSAPENVE